MDQVGIKVHLNPKGAKKTDKSRYFPQKLHKNSFSSTDTKASPIATDFEVNRLPLTKLSDNGALSSYFQQSVNHYSEKTDYFLILNTEKHKTPTTSAWFSDNIINRGILIEWVEEICIKFKFSARSLSLALLILDTIAQTLPSDQYESRLMMLICLSLSTKMQELPDNYLTIKSIFDFFEGQNSMAFLTDVERKIFKEMNYNLCQQTTLDFTLYFLSYGFVSKEELQQLQKDQLDVSTKLVEKYEIMIFTMNLEVLKCAVFNKFSRVIIACSIIAFVRNRMKLKNWDERLVRITRQCGSSLEECMLLLEKENFYFLDQELNSKLVNIMNIVYIKNSKHHPYLSKGISDFEDPSFGDDDQREETPKNAHSFLSDSSFFEYQESTNTDGFLIGNKFKMSKLRKTGKIHGKREVMVAFIRIKNEVVVPLKRIKHR